MGPIEQIRAIMAGQNGMVLTSDLAEAGIARTYLTILEERGEIERVSRGVYCATGQIEDALFAFQGIYQASVFSHETALYMHDLSDRSPLYFSVTVPTGYHSQTLEDEGHQLFYVQKELLMVGVEERPSEQGNLVRVTGLERTICDVVRSRNQLEVGMVVEALKKYVRRGDKRLDLLDEYAGLFRVRTVLEPYLTVLL